MLAVGSVERPDCNRWFCVHRELEYPIYHQNKHTLAISKTAQQSRRNKKRYLDIIRVQPEDRIESTIEWSHQCRAHIRVTETERMSELMSGHLEQVGAAAAADGPVLSIVEMRIAAIHREVGMGKGAAWTVKRIAIAVLVLLETDLNMHWVGAFRRECQIGVFAPDAEGTRDLLVDLQAVQSLRVLRDAVGERLHLPAAALQRVAFRARIAAEADLVLDTAARQLHQIHRVWV